MTTRRAPSLRRIPDELRSLPDGGAGFTQTCLRSPYGGSASQYRTMVAASDAAAALAANVQSLDLATHSMTMSSVQSAPGNSLPTKALASKSLALKSLATKSPAADGDLSSNDDSDAPVGFQSQLESLCSDGKTPSGKNPSPPQRKRARDTDNNNLQSAVPVQVTDQKKPALPPFTLAMPALPQDASDAKQADSAQSQAEDAAPEAVDSQANVPDAKAAEILPAALAFAARLSLPAFGNAVADQTRLKSLPSQKQDSTAPKGSSSADQIKVKAPPQQSAAERDPEPSEKPPTPVSAAAGTAQSDARHAKEPDVPPAAPADKTDVVFSRIEPKSGDPTVLSSRVQDSSPSPSPSVADRMEHVIEPAAAPAASSNDIRVRVPDNSGGSTEVRFVEAAGEVRVSVRTANSDLAQTLRSGLEDLSHKLSNDGVRAEIWHPGASASQSSFSQRSPQQDQQQDQRGSGGRDDANSGSGKQGSEGRGQSGSQQNKPQWLEELEASTSDRKD